MYYKDMDVLKAFRYRLDPSSEDIQKVRSWGGAKRYVWNRLLSERMGAWKALGKEPSKEAKKAFNKAWSYKAMSKRVTRWRSELEWLDEMPYHASQNAAKQLSGAYKNWWAGLAGPPQYKKKRDASDSWSETDKVQLDINGQAVKLPKLGWVKAHISRPFEGIIRQATVKQEGDGWYVSVLSMVSIKVPENTKPPIGIDRGVVHAAMDSDGAPHDLCVETEEETRWLKHLAKEVSRKQKGSRNKAKAQKRLNKAKRQIRRRVLHETHRFTTAMAKNHSLVAIEDLSVKNMTASAAGTKEAPGKNVAAKRGLNREILARNWGEIRRQLEYKCIWYGSRLILVPPAYSSQECSVCGHIASENRKTQESFVCVKCGHSENADVNAAKVILKRALELVAAGHAVTACGEDVRRRLGHAASVKQEPTRKARKRAI
jgi:putative transposase